MKFTFVTEIKSENLMDDDPADKNIFKPYTRE
jgi:hypothetical protein